MTQISLRSSCNIIIPSSYRCLVVVSCHFFWPLLQSRWRAMVNLPFLELRVLDVDDWCNDQLHLPCVSERLQLMECVSLASCVLTWHLSQREGRERALLSQVVVADVAKHPVIHCRAGLGIPGLNAKIKSNHVGWDFQRNLSSYLVICQVIWIYF